MRKFPVDAPKQNVIKALEILGFRLVREKEHISMVKENPDRSRTPLTMPNHLKIKASTLRTICTQANISRDENSLKLMRKHNCKSDMGKTLSDKSFIKLSNPYI
jgi:predicted RNA binding protein YcfA (HicA-like mRNA interferase family)